MSGGKHDLLTGVEVRGEDADRWAEVATAYAEGEALLSEPADESPALLEIAPCPVCEIATRRGRACRRCGPLATIGDYLAAFRERDRDLEVGPFDAIEVVDAR